MPKSPFYKVVIRDSGFDLTDFITSFDYEESVSKDNTLTLQMIANNNDLFDRRGLVEGVILSFRYGYLQGQQTVSRIARVSNINPSYSSTIRISIKATDLGILAKKNTSDKVWENITASSIAQTIAARYGLTPIIEPTSTVYTSIAQGNKTDYEFLEELALGETTGSYRFFIKGGELHFNRRNLNQPSLKKYTWLRGEGSLLSFAPRSKEISKKGASRETSVLGLNSDVPDVQVSANNTTAVDDTKLDRYAVHFNNNGEQLNPSAAQAQAQANDPNKTGDKIVTPTKTPQNALNIANKIKKDTALKDLTAQCTVEMDPAIVSDSIITVDNVSNKYSGNWYIETIRVVITKGAPAKHTLTLNKNAQSRPLEDNALAPVTNTAEGPDETNVKKEVNQVNFDNDGNRI